MDFDSLNWLNEPILVNRRHYLKLSFTYQFIHGNFTSAPLVRHSISSTWEVTASSFLFHRPRTCTNAYISFHFTHWSSPPLTVPNITTSHFWTSNFLKQTSSQWPPASRVNHFMWLLSWCHQHARNHLHRSCLLTGLSQTPAVVY